eukprot:scaffold227798_cov21-Prasinocladus_malaysianus.AAC.1
MDRQRAFRPTHIITPVRFIEAYSLAWFTTPRDRTNAKKTRGRVANWCHGEANMPVLAMCIHHVRPNVYHPSYNAAIPMSDTRTCVVHW